MYLSRIKDVWVRSKSTLTTESEKFSVWAGYLCKHGFPHLESREDAATQLSVSL